MTRCVDESVIYRMRNYVWMVCAVLCSELDHMVKSVVGGFLPVFAWR